MNGIISINVHFSEINNKKVAFTYTNRTEIKKYTKKTKPGKFMINFTAI